MTRTRPLTLIITALLGVLVGFTLNHILTLTGQPTFAPAITMPILLALLAVFVIALALPVRRAARGGASIDPFRATRTVALAKASSILGAAVGGAALGLIGYLLTLPVVPSLGSMAATIATFVCAGILLAAALVAEHMCTIQKKDDDDDTPPTGVEAH